MSGLNWAVTVAGVVAFAASSYAVVGDAGIRSWASAAAGRAWTRWVAAAGVLVSSAAAWSFTVSPPTGAYLFAAGGVFGFAAASLAAAGAADVASAASGDGSVGRRVRAFWYAAATEFRVTRYGLVVSVAGFALASLAGGVSVDPVLRTVGALSLGGVLACVMGLAAVGVFVPGSRNESAARDVERAS
ncbi:hypothetical protein [Halobacterium litoreum]|uniref:Uncharacterized protein n=1 Tax=Halobacterium litoreum TaxID=2039234 RepID=A0ABD5NC55_9EURY|nr:hypothetical protein [Halobacterium litoreum]UHH14255.1 hypothetical protein LT972_04450 [Halobacterium litoreum]